MRQQSILVSFLLISFACPSAYATVSGPDPRTADGSLLQIDSGTALTGYGSANRDAHPESLIRLAQASLSRNEVRVLQTYLAKYGYNPGPADGAAGPRTRQSVTAFQRDRMLPEEGQATGEVLTQILDFVDAGEIALVGSAVSDDVVKLTPAEDPEQVGAAWLADKQPVAEGFETDFRFRITGAGQNPGEGFALVIQNSDSSTAGQDGAASGIGYAGMENSVAIEFDTAQQESEIDPDGNHISVHTRGTAANTAHHDASLGFNSPLATMSDGRLHTAVIRYIPGTLSIFIDADLLFEVPLDLTETLELDDGKAWVGFTASTSADHREAHDILHWAFRSQGGMAVGARAKARLGAIFASGEGVAPNPTLAASWYKSAAESGHAEAQYVLGTLYLHGLGVGLDPKEATRLFRQSARQGHAEAQYTLGVIYANGLGVEQSDAEAMKFYQMAAGQGHEAAAASIEELQKTAALKDLGVVEAWKAISDTTSRAVLDAFIKQFPDTIYAGFAKARLAELPKTGTTAKPPGGPVVETMAKAKAAQRSAYKVQTRVSWVNRDKIGDKFIVDTNFESSVSGDDVPGGRAKFETNIWGTYRESEANFFQLVFKPKKPLGFDPPEYLTVCPGSREEKWPDGLYRAAIHFGREGNNLVAQQAECMAATLPDDIAFQIRYLTTSFRDIAIGMVESGSVDQIHHDGFREWMHRVARGEVVIR